MKNSEASAKNNQSQTADADHRDDKAQKQSQQNQQKSKGVNPNDPDNSTGGSRSEGNLSNSRYNRDRGTTLHDKTGVMGSDNDGQAS